MHVLVNVVAGAACDYLEACCTATLAVYTGGSDCWTSCAHCLAICSWHVADTGLMCCCCMGLPDNGDYQSNK